MWFVKITCVSDVLPGCCRYAQVLQAPSGAFCQFAVEEVLRDAALLHMPDVAEAAQTPPTKKGEHAVCAGLLQDFRVGDFLLPDNVSNTAQAPEVKAVKFLLVSCIGGPRLTAIKEYTEHACLVDAKFGLYCEVEVVSGSLVWLRYDCCSLGYSAVYLSVDSK